MKPSVYMSAVRKFRRKIRGTYGKKRKRRVQELCTFINRNQQAAQEAWFEENRKEVINA